MPALVHMPMFQFFGHGLAQVNHLDVEMQLIQDIKMPSLFECVQRPGVFT
jgi:hypothetical protein